MKPEMQERVAGFRKFVQELRFGSSSCQSPVVFPVVRCWQMTGAAP